MIEGRHRHGEIRLTVCDLGAGLPAGREQDVFDTFRRLEGSDRSKAGTGSFAFKKNWGFTPAPLAYRYRVAPGGSIPDHNPLNPKYRLFIAAWKRLPVPVANLLGPPIVRGVG